MYQTNYINNNNKIFLPSQSHDVYNHFYNFNRTYYNDNFNNNINSINIGNNPNNESKLNRNSEDDPENCIEKKEYLLKNTKEANISNQQSSDSKGRITKPIKRNTNCPHLNARHYAKVKIFNLNYKC